MDDKLESAPKPRKLLDQVRDAIRLKHYSLRTEQTYVDWIKRYIIFHRKEHPKEMGAPQVKAFLEHLAIDLHVSASTQNQALNALVFLYREIIGQDFGDLGDVLRANRPKRLPVVLSRGEVQRLKLRKSLVNSAGPGGTKLAVAPCGSGLTSFAVRASLRRDFERQSGQSCLRRVRW
jgi:Phage integrase, N-terminal SAM-like domain